MVYITSAARVDQGDELSENLGGSVDDIENWLTDTPISDRLADQA